MNIHSGRFVALVLVLVILGSRSPQRRRSAWLLLATLQGATVTVPSSDGPAIITAA